ncbi:hypothetical protein JCM10212_000349 [Sporobolomyces blumeae]
MRDRGPSSPGDLTPPRSRLHSVSSTSAPSARPPPPTTPPPLDDDESKLSLDPDHGPRRTYNFGFLPVPARCRFDDEFKFSLALNLLLAGTSTLSVANIYYPQPILVQLSERYSVAYETVSRVMPLLQGGYLAGLVFVVPTADLVKRRSLLVALVFASACMSLGQALAPTFATFEAISFLQGIVTVTPQVLNPLTADLAPAHRRTSALSITISGLIGGMVVGRIVAGVLTRFTSSPNNTFFFAAATQFSLVGVLWLFLPDFPKKPTGLRYHEILMSMVKLFLTEPVLVQACLVGLCNTAIFVSWWTWLTFLLNDAPFEYDTFSIGLFGLTGICSVLWSPFAGRFTDRLDPWLVTFLAVSGQFLLSAVAIASVGLNVAPVIVVCILVDVFQQTMSIGNQARIFEINPLARSRLTGVYMSMVFAGQALGSSVGPRVYLAHGWRVACAVHLAWGAAALGFLLVRGPNVEGWIGWRPSREWSWRRHRKEDERAKEKEEGEKQEESGRTIVVGQPGRTDEETTIVEEGDDERHLAEGEERTREKEDGTMLDRGKDEVDDRTKDSRPGDREDVRV